MLRRISFVFLLLFSILANATGTAGLNFQTYVAGGAQPSYTQDATGNITNRTLISTGTTSAVNYNWGSGGVLTSGRGDGVIVRFYGYVNIATAGTYYFGGNADDGLRIKVNNTSVVNSWIESGGSFRSGSIYLAAGVYPIEVMYYENGGGAMVNLQWYLNNSWQIVDSTYTATDSTYFTPPAPTYSSSITAAQQSRKTSETSQRTSQSGNAIYVEQVGDNNSITLRQGVTTAGKNRMEVYANGNSNTLNLNQGYNTNGTVSAGDSNTHYQYLNLSGNSNSVTTKQTGDGHFMENTVSGNNNTLNFTQTDGAPKTMFTNVNGSSNTINATQAGTGTHYLDINLTGNGHNVTANQSGAGNHATTLDLTNAGGSSTVNVTQQGSTAQTYSLQQSCANASGCSTTITQGQ